MCYVYTSGGVPLIISLKRDIPEHSKELGLNFSEDTPKNFAYPNITRDLIAFRDCHVVGMRRS